MSRGSWNRRDSAVTSNGYFTVLKSTGRVSAVRLPEGFRYQVGSLKENPYPVAKLNPTAAPSTDSKSASGHTSPDQAADNGMAILSQSIIPATQGHRLMRPALIVLAAAAITWILLNWLTRS